jgi:hypothetical protein
MVINSLAELSIILIENYCGIKKTVMGRTNIIPKLN